MAKNIGQLPTSLDPDVNTVADQYMHNSNSGKDKTRKNTRPKKKRKKTLRRNHKSRLPWLVRRRWATAQNTRSKRRIFLPTKNNNGDTPVSPTHSAIPVTSISHNNIATGPAHHSQDEINLVYTGDNDAEQCNDENERHLQPHEFWSLYNHSKKVHPRNSTNWIKNFCNHENYFS